MLIHIFFPNLTYRHNIGVVGFSSDGDVRLLNSMKHFTTCCCDRDEHNFLFSATNEEGLICIQDTVHIGTKNRNRSIKPSAFLPIGNKIVSVSHLKMLINNIDVMFFL